MRVSAVGYTLLASDPEITSNSRPRLTRLHAIGEFCVLYEPLVPDTLQRSRVGGQQTQGMLASFRESLMFLAIVVG